MINVLGAAPPDRSIQGPILVQRKQIIQVRSVGPALGFAAADALSRVFDNFAGLRDELRRVDAPPMDPRAADP